MHDPIRFGILGCGIIAPNHARAIDAAGGAVLAGAVSRRYEQAQQFAQAFSCRAYETYEAMLSDDAIDAVSVCTPTGLHFENARQALLADKHVLVEKPLCLTLQEADALIDLAQARSLSLGVISQSRFSDAAQAIRRLVDSDAAGRPVSAQLKMRFYRGQDYYDSAAWRGTFAGDGGVIMNQGIHGIDLLCYLMGKPVSVMGYARTRLRDIEVEDTVAAALAFESGAVAVIDATTCSSPSFHKRFILGFEKGTVILENDAITLWTVPGECPESCRLSLAGNTSGDNRKVTHAYHTREYGNFIRHITQGELLIVDGAQGRMPLSVILGVYESSRTGRRIDL